MTNYTVISGKHATLAASTVDAVTLAAGTPVVEVVNYGASPIYFTVDGSVPTVGGDDTKVVSAYGALKLDTPKTIVTPVVKLICAAAQTYSVQAV
jgi:hypothetical protein